MEVYDDNKENNMNGSVLGGTGYRPTAKKAARAPLRDITNEVRPGRARECVRACVVYVCVDVRLRPTCSPLNHLAGREDSY